MPGFNPHPSRRTGATLIPAPVAQRKHVSILTRPEGRVQRNNPKRLPIPQVGFNPHPSRRTGATSAGPQMGQHVVVCFNPHPSRRTGATVAWPRSRRCCSVSILTRPEGRVQPGHRLPRGRRAGVSILTRPEGRVQLPPPVWSVAWVKVSILTRPEGRVQPTCAPATRTGWMFQSSPVPKDGCNAEDVQLGDLVEQFQSSPVPKDGCNRGGSLPGDPPQLVSILTRPEGRVQLLTPGGSAGLCGFQSSPVPKDGCNPLTTVRVALIRAFQSSPVPKDGCNQTGLREDGTRVAVSILTRPEGRVQPNA